MGGTCLAAEHAPLPPVSSPAGQLAAAGSGDGKLGYIRIATFSRQTEEKVRAALQTLKEQVSRALDQTDACHACANAWIHAMRCGCHVSNLSWQPPFPARSPPLACSPTTAILPQGAERLVLDVRNNGGGLFPAGVEVGRMLLDRGDIVLIADR